MGNESSTAKSHSHFLRSYSEITRLNHDTFGEVRVLEHRSRKGEKIIEKIFTFSDEGTYKQALRMIELKAATKWPYYCQIMSHCTGTQWGCMAGGHMIRLAMEYHERSVFQASLTGSQVSENPTALDEGFGWKILHAMSQLAALFKRYELSLGLISPENVLLTANEEVRFLDMGLLTFSGTVFDRLRNRSLLVNYGLSPEQMEQVHNASNHPIDSEKTDVFCIGMFVLCAVLAEPYRTFYDFSTHEIQFETVFKKIMKLKKALFSDDFTDILVSCLQKDPVQRPTAKQLHAHVQTVMSSPRISTQSSKQSRVFAL